MTATLTDSPRTDVPKAGPQQSDTTVGWLRRLSRYVGAHRRDVTIAMLASVLGSASLAAVPLVARRVIDDGIVAGSAPIGWLLAALLGFAVLAFGFAYLRRFHGGRMAFAVQYDLRNALHDHLQEMDADHLSQMPTGQLVSRANSDTALVQRLLAFFPIQSGNLVLLVLSVVIMLVLSPGLAVVSIVVIPVVFAISYRMRRKVFPASWDAQQREGEVAQIVDENVAGVRVVKAFGQERRELDRIVDVADGLYGSRMRSVRLLSRYQPLLETVPVFGQVAVLALGGWLTLRGQLTIGTFLAFSTYVAQFTAPARQLAGVLTVAQQARAGVERICQLLDTPTTIVDAPDARPLPPVRGEIHFDHVDFAYPGGRPVLTDLDLHVAAGERVALIGPSGSGKSTCVALLARFSDPTSGRVLVDGHDVRDATLTSLRGALGIAFEDSMLFSDTVCANIAYGRPDATDAEVEAAARAAAADDFIAELPDGWDTKVGERGLTLSGGQRQRIALARALLRDPRILVLDDATSAVDSRTEERIHAALAEVTSGRTTLLIAHRSSTLRLADRVVVLDEGRIVDQGSHEELTRRNADYRALVSGWDDGAGGIEESGPRHADTAGPGAYEVELESDDDNRCDEDFDAALGLTPSAWRPADDETVVAPGFVGTSGAAAPTRAAGGPGGPGGHGGGRSSGLDLAATPELLARVAALPPISDRGNIDLERESRHVPRFGLGVLLREFRRPLTVGLVLTIVDALAGVVGPALVKSGIDHGVIAGSAGVLFAAAAAYLVVTLVALGNQVGATLVTGRTAERIMMSLRVRIFAQLQRLSLDFYEREMAGRVMTRMTTDVDQFESLIENGITNALVAFATFIGVGVALLILNPELALVTLSVIVPLVLATVVFRRKAVVLYDVARERLAVVNAAFSESLAGIRESQAFTHEAATIAAFRESGRSYLASRVAAQRLVATYFPFVQFLSAVATAVVLGVGAELVRHGHLTAGALIAFILYIDLFFSPIQQLSQVFDAWQQTRVSVNRIADLMRLHTLTPAPDDPVVLPRVQGELQLDDIFFHYPTTQAVRSSKTDGADAAEVPANADVLHDVELTVRPGETVALVGETGAGKSTIVKLVARFYDPTGGSVRLDGVDLRRLELSTFRQHLGYVPQEPFLFTGSVRDNIAYGRPDAGDAEVEAAARAVGAHDVVARLPGGYTHEIAERGRSLSSGQRQLLALARAELVDPAVLLLDEATSNLDLVTEARVTAAMQQVARRRTTLVIAHRLQTARTADRIVVMDGGRAVESGTHDELVGAGGRYAEMWQAFELAEPAS